MKPALEDLFLGPGSTPSISQELRFRWEDSQRQVRVVYAGVTIAKSTRVMRLQEFGHLPVYYFPLEDVRKDVLEKTDHHTHSPLKGKASYWSANVGGKIFKDIMWNYRETLPASSPIHGLFSFFNERVDAIYVDGELMPKPRTPWSE